MQPQLPTTIARFFELENAAEPASIAPCFTADAEVRDEGETRQGRAAIDRWMTEARAKYQHQARPLSAQDRDGWTVVDVELTGRFPGSPIRVPHAFRLAGEEIAELKIG